MKELTPRPMPDVRQMTNRQLLIADIKENAKVMSSESKRALKEAWQRAWNTSRMLLGQPLIEYEPEEIGPEERAEYERMQEVIAEMSRRRSIRQQRMREREEQSQEG